MGEVLFYHLTRSNLESTLPGLLERSLARGWKALVRVGVPERLAALDSHLWSYSDSSFLPHGLAGDAHAARQPVCLTGGEGNPNEAEVLFLVDGARTSPDEMQELTRTVLMFDGRDQEAVAQARDDWRVVTAAGLEAVYWAQEDNGWVEKARSNS